MRAGFLGMTILAACGGSGDAGLTTHEGVYTVASWTRNESNCDVEGPSIAANQDPNFFIKSENFFGEQFINVNVCPSVASCQTDARDDGTLHIGQWGFQAGSDSDGWTDDSAFAFEVQATCEATRVRTRMVFAGDGVTIEERTSSGTFTPQTAGVCSDEEALVATEASPCETLEVVTADFAATF